MSEPLRKLLIAAVLVCLVATPRAFAERTIMQSLDGRWELSSDDRKTWRDVAVPATFEEQIDRSFDGVAWLRRSVGRVPVPDGHRLLLDFDAVATEATVWLNGQRVGTHLGGWTPFRCDITDVAKQAAEGPWELLVRVDEKVGHNTQGFLPAITEHFGGIWQGVRLLQIPEGGIDDLGCLAWGNPATGQLELEIPFGWGELHPSDVLGVCTRLRGESGWSRELRLQLTSHKAEARDDSAVIVRDHRARLRVPLPPDDSGRVAPPRLWSPESPQLYEVRVQVFRDGSACDEHVMRAAFRTVEAHGRQLLLNGKPLNVRGLLNWGYRQTGTSPATDPLAIREELELVRRYGFNLMKMCLWVPPRAVLDLADELGVLVWMEYPAWHPKFTPQFLDDLTREYGEFFAHDRNHPSVILRSLTCETGQSADLGVIKSLYELCRAAVPHALVEDDSSWIEWNRVHDFYDDHPYGNNHTWPGTLQRLNRYVSDRSDKPLMLGEAIAADTWYGPVAPNDRWEDSVSPPGFAAGNRHWLDRMTSRVGPATLRHLRDDSLHYAYLMRKYQIETFRRDVPLGGYVVSVIRDFPLAGMGMIDYFDRPKWEPSAWSWHGDTMLLLETPGDCRSFTAAKPITGELLISHFGSRPVSPGKLSLELQNSDGTVLARSDANTPLIEPGQVVPLSHFSWQAPETRIPLAVRLVARFRADGADVSNHWPLWILPGTSQQLPALSTHDSWDIPAAELGLEAELPARRFTETDAVNAIVLTRKLDTAVLGHLERGGRALMLPNDRPGSFPLRQHWFLRGGPLVHDRFASAALPRELFVELQHFDLAGPVVPELHYLDEIDPLLALWDNHDIKEVKTHGLVFEMPVGRGRLLVSALRHTDPDNTAGHYVFAQLVRRLDEPAVAAGNAGDTNLKRLRGELARREFALDRETWKFMPDTEHSGIDRGWNRTEFDDADWPTIRIDRHWEAQGYEKLDGWAWYRCRVRIPADWPDGHCYLNFTGVDDYYRVYVNGQYVGSGGDIETRQTAFEERKSHDVSAHIQAGRTANISVEVYDWYGAGGIFRPVSLSVTPLSSRPPILK